MGADDAAILPMTPYMSPAATAPAHHATITGNSRRTVSPNAESSPNGRRRATSGDANTPSPASRRAASLTASADSASTAKITGTSGHASLVVKGCMRSTQPNGVAQSSHRVAEPESAAIRTTIATPNTTMPSPLATRRVRPSCEVTAPTPVNTAAGIARLRPNSADSPNPKPTLWFAPATNVSNVVPAKTTPTAAPNATSVEAVARAGRVLPAIMSCQRPASSSPRSRRVAASNAQMAPTVVRNTKTL